jgi:hypothetical protein
MRLVAADTRWMLRASQETSLWSGEGVTEVQAKKNTAAHETVRRIDALICDQVRHRTTLVEERRRAWRVRAVPLLDPLHEKEIERGARHVQRDITCVSRFRERFRSRGNPIPAATWSYAAPSPISIAMELPMMV